MKLLNTIPISNDVRRSMIVSTSLFTMLVLFCISDFWVTGGERWQFWFGVALVPAIILKWMNIIRRQRLPLLENSALVFLVAVSVFGWYRTEGINIPIAGLVGVAVAAVIVIAWRFIRAKG